MFGKSECLVLGSRYIKKNQGIEMIYPWMHKLKGKGGLSQRHEGQ